MTTLAFCSPVQAQENEFGIPDVTNELEKNFKCYNINELDTWLNENDYYPVFYWKNSLYEGSAQFFWFNSKENILVVPVVPSVDKTLACVTIVSTEMYINNEGFERFIRDYLTNKAKKNEKAT